ncbi:MAG: RNA-binding transcriptional accessory protein [Candidatus Auribacter fodinae]|uniref:RNA-binding transcriptional accessory protein n=1 Tax=Candidatus Auribacter fodinae TaxID=2093366 RepID=A0A3A4QPM1_9BACT|nr:MAG: RNA-binding transcriptional accessory protein [Candidatus Auribacter fodinae]
MMNITRLIAEDCSIAEKSVQNTIRLFDDGATVPFIARYRKEVTGNLDETQIRDIKERHTYYTELNERKETIIASIKEQDALTENLLRKIESTTSKTELEDIYLPYKPKRKTRAVIAREKGLEPLAKRMMAQQDVSGSADTLAASFITNDVPDTEAALNGARDIIAEWVNEDSAVRQRLRQIFFQNGSICSAVKKDKKGEPSKFEQYYDFQEAVKSIPSHRALALFRGENEDFLSLSIEVPRDTIITELNNRFIKNKRCIFAAHIENAVSDAFQRLLHPSISTDIRQELKEKADLTAIDTFAKNLRTILLAPPLGAQPVIALDPGFRTGIKTAVLDATGRLLEHTAIYPLAPHSKTDEAHDIIQSLIKRYAIKYIAVGNGTAGRETEAFIRDHSKLFRNDIQCVMVNESGASIYSVSDKAREEFPDLDATVRGAVSIGRRLQDPLAELVKIEPRSLGVGQYQHDVNQNLLRSKLDDEVEHCVNLVGVDLNTASADLLSYTAGIGPKLAQEIVKYRSENGQFSSRKELMSVPRLGAKAFEQCAGFLRIRNGKNPLDASAIHPESYPIVERILRDLKASITDIMGNERLISSIRKEQYVSETTGVHTLNDIIAELLKPGRDPRKSFEAVAFREDIREITDLQPGMVLPGIVTNVTNFGAFVDIGVHQDGLVHISELANSYISDPHDIVSTGDPVTVKVVSVDTVRKRVSLSMKQAT